MRVNDLWEHLACWSMFHSLSLSVFFLSFFQFNPSTPTAAPLASIPGCKLSEVRLSRFGVALCDDAGACWYSVLIAVGNCISTHSAKNMRWRAGVGVTGRKLLKYLLGESRLGLSQVKGGDSTNSEFAPQAKAGGSKNS